jgi:hypothetical protein
MILNSLEEKNCLLLQTKAVYISAVQAPPGPVGARPAPPAGPAPAPPPPPPYKLLPPLRQRSVDVCNGPPEQRRLQRFCRRCRRRSRGDGGDVSSAAGLHLQECHHWIATAAAAPAVVLVPAMPPPPSTKLSLRLLRPQQH